MPEPADANGPRRRSIWLILLLLIAALLIGMGGMAWLFHRFDGVAEAIRPAAPAAAPLPAPVRSEPLVSLAPPPPPQAVDTIVDQRIDKIEDKVEDIDARAQTAASDAHRAESLLVAFAARRAIDRGAPLGYLEPVLRERFGGIEPQAVATIISAARQPVTISTLRDELDTLEPVLSSSGTEGGWLEGIRRELAGLIVIRRASAPSASPVDRFARAQRDLDAGRVDSALTEIARLPGRKAAEDWIGRARRYVQTRAALDRIESAALLQPSKPAAPAPSP